MKKETAKSIFISVFAILVGLTAILGLFFEVATQSRISDIRKTDLGCLISKATSNVGNGWKCLAAHLRKLVFLLEVI